MIPGAGDWGRWKKAGGSLGRGFFGCVTQGLSQMQETAGLATCAWGWASPQVLPAGETKQHQRGSVRMETIATFRAVGTPSERHLRGRLEDFVPPLPAPVVQQAETPLPAAVEPAPEPLAMPAVEVASPTVSATAVVADAGCDGAAECLKTECLKSGPEAQGRKTAVRSEPSHPLAATPRRRSRPVGPRKPSRERPQPGRWGGVAVLAVVAALVWAAVLAVEYRGPASPQTGEPVVRLAAEPESTGGRSVR